jgi:integrase/recombinase XerD
MIMNLLAIQDEEVIIENVFDTEAMIRQFIENADIKANSKSTYRRQLKPFFEWLSSRNLMSELRSLSHLDIVSYKENLICSGKSSYTVSGYLTVVRKFFEWLEA